MQATTGAGISAAVRITATGRIRSRKVHAGDIPCSVAAERIDEADPCAATLVGAVGDDARHAAALQQITTARRNGAGLVLGGAGVAGDSGADTVPKGVAAVRILRTHRCATCGIVTGTVVVGSAAIASAHIAADITTSARGDGARNVDAISIPLSIAAVGVFCAYRSAADGII